MNASIDILFRSCCEGLQTQYHDITRTRTRHWHRDVILTDCSCTRKLVPQLLHKSPVYFKPMFCRFCHRYARICEMRTRHAPANYITQFLRVLPNSTNPHFIWYRILARWLCSAKQLQWSAFDTAFDAISRCGWWKLVTKYWDVCLNTMRNKSQSIFIFGSPVHELGADVVDRHWALKLHAYRPWLSIVKWCFGGLRSVPCLSDLTRRSNASRDCWESAIATTSYLTRECRPW